MPHTIAIVSAVLVHAWFLADRWPREVVLLPAGLSFSDHPFRPEAPGVGLRIPVPWCPVWSGRCRSPCCSALSFWRSAPPWARCTIGATSLAAWPLVLWGGAQQWVLQTVVLRECQRATSRRTGIFLAALLFGVVHLPNPFLAPVTFGAGLLWCWLYDRYPNIVPLALSHALGTLAVLHAFDQDITGRLRIGAAYLRLGE